MKLLKDMTEQITKDRLKMNSGTDLSKEQKDGFKELDSVNLSIRYSFISTLPDFEIIRKHFSDKELDEVEMLHENIQDLIQFEERKLEELKINGFSEFPRMSLHIFENWCFYHSLQNDKILYFKSLKDWFDGENVVDEILKYRKRISVDQKMSMYRARLGILRFIQKWHGMPADRKER